MGKSETSYTQAYRETVYSIWVINNRPSIAALSDLIEPDERGMKPSGITMNNWKTEGAWEDRANIVDVEIQQTTDRKLVEIRMEMMKRHAELSKELSEKAFEYLNTVGFDSSASAVSALFKSFDEEKKSRGMEVALTQVFSMTDEDLQKTMNRLLSRSKGLSLDEESSNIVDAEEVNAVSIE